MKTKKFTILHSNDMHGDFFADSAPEVLEEFLRNNQNISREVEGRLVYKK